MPPLVLCADKILTLAAGQTVLRVRRAHFRTYAEDRKPRLVNRSLTSMAHVATLLGCLALVVVLLVVRGLVSTIRRGNANNAKRARLELHQARTLAVLCACPPSSCKSLSFSVAVVVLSEASCDVALFYQQYFCWHMPGLRAGHRVRCRVNCLCRLCRWKVL